MGPVISPETPVTNYHSTLYKIPEERRSRSEFSCAANSKVKTTLHYLYRVG